MNAKDKSGNTPLHKSALAGYRGLTEVLIKHGADVNAKNYSGVTPLHCAAMRGWDGIVQQLLKAGADISIRGTIGKFNDCTPLQIANKMSEAYDAGISYAKTIELLKNHKTGN